EASTDEDLSVDSMDIERMISKKSKSYQKDSDDDNSFSNMYTRYPYISTYDNKNYNTNNNNDNNNIKNTNNDNNNNNNTNNNSKSNNDNGNNNSALPSALCLICCENAADIVFVPCGHICVCESCSKPLKQDTPPTCIVCRQTVSIFQKIYTCGEIM
ncbi:hypothetical protein RFI_09070, partial [Reticulomyxa filosa]